MDKLIAYLVANGATPEDAALTARRLLGPQVTLGRATGEGAHLTDQGADRRRYAEAISAHPQFDKLIAQWDARRTQAPPPPQAPAFSRPSGDPRSTYAGAMDAHSQNPTGFLAKEHVQKLIEQWENRSAAWADYDRRSK
jgi:hypothetical protein